MIKKGRVNVQVSNTKNKYDLEVAQRPKSVATTHVVGKYDDVEQRLHRGAAKLKRNLVPIRCAHRRREVMPTTHFATCRLHDVLLG